MNNLHAKGNKHGFQHGAVHIPHLSGAGSHLRRNQLIAGGNDTDSQLFDYRHLYSADGSQGTDVLGGQHSALLQDHLAGIYIIPPEDHILTGSCGLGNTDGSITVIFGILHHHHTVRPLGHRAACGNGNTFFRIQCKFRTLAHEHFPLQRQNGWDGIGAAEGIPRPDGEAIHGGTVKIGHIFLSGNIFRQHPAHSRAQRNQLRSRNRSKFTFNQSQNFFRRFYM